MLGFVRWSFVSVVAVGCGGLAAQGSGREAGADRTVAAPDASVDVETQPDVVSNGGEAEPADAFCPPCDHPGGDGALPCPPTPPKAGDDCTPPASGVLTCEYGKSWWMACNDVLRCTVVPGYRSQWLPVFTGRPPYCNDPDAAGACPATWAEATAIDAGMLCPSADCQYPEGYCECLDHCGGGGAKFHPSLMGMWRCQAATAECPSPRPLSGTACNEVDAGFCNYAWPCGCGQTLECTGGLWEGTPATPCP